MQFTSAGQWAHDPWCRREARRERSHSPPSIPPPLRRLRLSSFPSSRLNGGAFYFSQPEGPCSMMQARRSSRAFPSLPPPSSASSVFLLPSSPPAGAPQPWSSNFVRLRCRQYACNWHALCCVLQRGHRGAFVCLCLWAASISGGRSSLAPSLPPALLVSVDFSVHLHSTSHSLSSFVRTMVPGMGV